MGRKIILEFTDEDIDEQYEVFEKNAKNFWRALSDMHSQLRAWYKYGEEESIGKQKLWDKFHDILVGAGVDVDDVI